MDWDQLLRDNGLRITKQRKTILSAIEEVDRPISCEELYDSYRGDELDLSTIYRNVSTMVEKEILRKTTDVEGNHFYQLNQEDHKHFVTCLSCKDKYYLSHCPVEEWERSIEAESGYLIQHHNFEFSGLCPKCRKEGK